MSSFTTVCSMNCFYSVMAPVLVTSCLLVSFRGSKKKKQKIPGDRKLRFTIWRTNITAH